MTNQQPGTISPAEVDDGPNNIPLGIAVAVLAVLVAALAGMAVIDPVSLVSLAPEWLARPGNAQIIAGTALTVAIGGMLYKAVRIAGEGHHEVATWLTLGALLMVPWFSVV